MKSWDEHKLSHLSGSNRLQNNLVGIGLLWMILDHRLNMSPPSGQHDQGKGLGVLT